MEKPGHNKIFEALDATLTGTWTVKNSFEFNNPDAEETIGTFSSATWRGGRASFRATARTFRCASILRELAQRRCPTRRSTTGWPTMKLKIDDANFNDLRFLAINLPPEDTLELSVTRDVNRYEDLAWAGAYSRWRKVAILNRRPVFAVRRG